MLKISRLARIDQKTTFSQGKYINFVVGPNPNANNLCFTGGSPAPRLWASLFWIQTWVKINMPPNL
jgi:hypothetical protein